MLGANNEIILSENLSDRPKNTNSSLEKRELSEHQSESKLNFIGSVFHRFITLHFVLPSYLLFVFLLHLNKVGELVK